MDFNYTETQDMLRDTLARFLADTYDFETRKKMIASGEGRDPGKLGHRAVIDRPPPGRQARPSSR